MRIKGRREDFELLLDPDYFVRYEAYNRILEANGIPARLADIPSVFSRMASLDEVVTEEVRNSLQQARDELERFVLEYGKPIDFAHMTAAEIDECFLDACSGITEKPDIGRIRELVEHGADINARDRLGFTALKKATHIYDYTIMKFFLDRGVDINEPVRYTDGAVSTVWLEKVGYAGLDDLRLMLGHGARPNDRDSVGNTALLRYCAAKPCRDGIALLLEHGADAASVNSEGNSALHAVARQEVEREGVLLLIGHGANVGLRNASGDTPLHVNARFQLAGDERCAACLLENGADPDAVTTDGDSALILAARSEKERVVQVLMAHGARTDIRDAAGQTACDIALAKGFPAIATMIDPAAAAAYQARADRGALEKVKRMIIGRLKAGQTQYRSDKEGYSVFSWRASAYPDHAAGYLYERFENGAPPPDVTHFRTDEEALEYLYQTNRTRSAGETELSVYEAILGSIGA